MSGVVTERLLAYHAPSDAVFVELIAAPDGPCDNSTKYAWSWQGDAIPDYTGPLLSVPAQRPSDVAKATCVVSTDDSDAPEPAGVVTNTEVDLVGGGNPLSSHAFVWKGQQGPARGTGPTQRLKPGTDVGQLASYTCVRVGGTCLPPWCCCGG